MHTYIIIARKYCSDFDQKIEKMILITGDFTPLELARIARDYVKTDPDFNEMVEEYVVFEIEITGYANYTIGTIVNKSTYPILDFESSHRKYLGSFHDKHLREMEEQQ